MSEKITNENCLMAKLLARAEAGQDAKPAPVTPAAPADPGKQSVEDVAKSLFANSLKKTEAGLAKAREAAEAGWKKAPAAKKDDAAPPAAQKQPSIVEQVLAGTKT